MTEWKPEEITAHIDYYRALNRELSESGELIEVHALTRPEMARIVIADGATAPVVTEGPFAEFKEMIACYELVDIESEARAIEIAAKLSAVPGPGGKPLRQPIGERQVMSP